MKRTISAVALTLALAAGAAVLPHSVLAASPFDQNRAKVLQQQQFVEAVSPGDADAQELLSLLGITLENTDSTWTDANFVEMVLKYKSVKARLSTVITEAGQLALDAFDMAEYAGQVDNEQFAQFALTESDRAEMETFRAELEANLDMIKQDPQALFDLLTGFTEGFGDFGDLEPYDEQAPYAYGYYEPYETVVPGHIVWLYDDSYNPLESDMTITWTQVDGPEVTWINTTCDTCRAFIAPSLDGYDYDYITFEVTADNGHAMDSNYVYVYISQPIQGEIADAYREIVGTEPDMATVDYWQMVMDTGFSIEQIRAHFDLMKKQWDMNNA